MPTHPFFVLEKLFRLDAVKKELVEKGRKIIEQDPDLLKYIHQQCKLADEALQGNYSIKSILLLDRVGIKTLDELWKYRQFIAAIYGYRAARSPQWIPTNSTDEHYNQELLRELQPQTNKHCIEGVILTRQQPLLSPLELQTILEL